MTPNEIAKEVVDAAFKVHTKLGPGLFESVYETVLEYELRKHGFFVERQKLIPISYEDLLIEDGFRIDLLVNNTVILELKSVDQIVAVHKKQLLTYLRLTDKPLGLLINFNVDLIKNGITRLVNGLIE